MNFFTQYLASTYGGGSYDNNVYSSTGNGGSLVNTGSAALAVTAVAVLILLVALFVVLKRKRK